MTTHTFTFGDHSVTISDAEHVELAKAAREGRDSAMHKDIIRCANMGIEDHKEELKELRWWNWIRKEEILEAMWYGRRNIKTELENFNNTDEIVKEVVYNKYIK